MKRFFSFLSVDVKKSEMATNTAPHAWLASLVAFLLLLNSPSAFSYIGPGAGLTAIGSALALFAAILLGIFGFVWYPIKRVINRKKSKQNLMAESTEVNLEGIKPNPGKEADDI